VVVAAQIIGELRPVWAFDPLQRVAQAADIFPPSGDQTIGVGVVAFVSRATLSNSMRVTQPETSHPCPNFYLHPCEGMIFYTFLTHQRSLFTPFLDPFG